MLIKNDPNIKEIEIFEYCYLYTAHADNTIFFLKYENSIVNLSENFNGALSGLRQFLATESPLKMMKNAFFSPQKLFSFPRYLRFCLDFLVM